ncbi:protein STICHEL-like isoform X2 [Phragmites australis]|nr:protein STICHEL-like isoform X2 [Phragmites australis]
MGTMVGGCVGPSELHLRKELTALQKARFLQDPETCSTWRSPLSSRSLMATSAIIHNSGIAGNLAQKHIESPSAPLKSDKKQKKVYLYNWRQNSNKSSENGLKLDANAMQVSGELSLDSPCNSNGLNSKGDACLDAPASIYNVQSSTSCTPVKRIARRRKGFLSKKGAVRNPSVSKLLDLQVNSGKSGEQSEDTENCNSESQELFQGGYFSRPTSPLFATCGCVSSSNPSKLLKMGRREGSSFSCTPVSTSSYYRHGRRNTRTFGSWDARTATSFDGDESNQSALLRSQRFHVPCNSSNKRKHRGSEGSYYSPSLSAILRRKGSSLLCGSQTLHRKKRSLGSMKWAHSKKSARGMPLLGNSCDFGSSSFDSSSDELSTNIGELDMEASSRLDGKRWSSCKSQDGIDLAVRGADVATLDQRSLSQKYRPKAFSEVVGQNIVAQSLSNAVTRDRIAPAYLFQGPRGTGKTSAARIFSAALCCLSTGDNKPCGICKECTDFFSGNGTNLIELDASNRKSISRIKNFLENAPPSATSSQYKVFVVDECHMVSSKVWSAFMKFLDEPLTRVVFLFITIYPDNLPRAVISRCQKYVFSKIKDIDIVCRLRRICVKENLDVELAALDLIALNSDGSLREAETMLDQLSLLGKKITPSLVNDLVGVVSEEKLLDLLEIAMSADTAETIKRSRELMDSGIDPMALMSQLAGLIMDIIAGTYKLADFTCCNRSAVDGRSLTDAELERLQQALKILSDAEKQIRLSSERPTWFTAALLKLGCGHSSDMNQPTDSTREHPKAANDVVSEAARESSSSRTVSHSLSAFGISNKTLDPKTISVQSSPQVLASHSSRSRLNDNLVYGECRSVNRVQLNSNQLNGNCYERRTLVNGNSDNLAQIWTRCIENCHSKTLQQLLLDHGKLVSITQFEGYAIAFIAFEDCGIKSRAQRFLSSITNSIETVLKCNVEVKMGPLAELINEEITLEAAPKVRRVDSDVLSCSSNIDRLKGTLNSSRTSFDHPDEVKKELEKYKNTPAADERLQSVSITLNSGIPKARGPEVPTQMSKVSINDEQRLESAWLQAVEKQTSGVMNQARHDRHQLLSQVLDSQFQRKSSMPLVMPSSHADEDLAHEIEALKIVESYPQKHQNRRSENGYAISPSKLHSNDDMANCDKESVCSEPGRPGCHGLFPCWKAKKQKGVKVKRQIRVKSS